jgi:uncharacterized protein YrrD
MLNKAKELLGKKLLAKDGEIGKVEDLYFDGHEWVLRYFVVDTGPWILGRKVLLSLYALEKPDWTTELLPVNLTREQVKNSPEIDFAQPVSRQQEVDLFGYYGWPGYWQVPLMNPTGIAPILPVSDVDLKEEKQVESDESETQHLRSLKKVIGYKVKARDGEIGHIEDFVVDDENWKINYFIVDTGGWFQKGNQVMLAPHWITGIDLDSSTVSIDLKQDTIRSSPEFEPERVLENQ